MMRYGLLGLRPRGVLSPLNRNLFRKLAFARQGVRMKKRMKLLTTGMLILFVGGVSAFAQGRPEGSGHGPGGGGRGPGGTGGEYRLLSAEMRGGKVVKGAPYAAEAVMESTHTLADGTKLTSKSVTLQYRDSEGRTRKEQSFSNAGPFASAGEAPKVVFINDPVAGLRYSLFAQDRTASKLSIQSRPTPPSSSAAPRPPHHPDSAAQNSSAPTPPESKTESLGKQTIEGVEAEGTRTTMTIPAGKIGNDRAIEIISERWYSSALQLVVLSKHNDPRWGEDTYKLTKINRTEPAHSLFEVPADYTITEGRGFPGKGGEGMRGKERPREK